MKKIAIFLVYIIVITSVLLGGTASFASNYMINYELYPAEDITSTSAVISGKIIQGEEINDDITLPGYGFELVVYETGSLSSKLSIPLSYARGTYEFSEKVENLKPDTVYSYYVSGGINVTPVSGTPTERTFKTLADEIGDFKYGDVNEDNKVNSTDHSLLKRYILEIVTELSEKGLKAADVNADGKINSSDLALIKRFILELIDIFPAEEELKYKWVPCFEAGDQRIGFKVDKGEDGNYTAKLSFTFPDSGFRVIYKDEVTKELPEKGDSYDMIFNGGNVQVERYTGPALTVITTKEITYNLGQIDPGKYKLIIDIYGIQREFSFEVKEDEYKWVPYLEDEFKEVYLSVTKGWGDNYIATLSFAFPDAGYRVVYKDEVTKELPEEEDSCDMIFKGGNAQIERFTGMSLDGITRKEITYNLGQIDPGEYKFIVDISGIQKEFAFKVTGNEYSWLSSYDGLGYQRIRFSVDKVEGGNYVASILFTFPNSGYRIIYKDEVTKVLPEKGDSCDMIFNVGGFRIEKYTGPSFTVITTERITYNLGKIKPGIYRFQVVSDGIEGIGTMFEVKENEEKWIPYQLRKDQVAYSVDQNTNGDYIVNVKMTFPSGGFRVDYTDEVTEVSYESPVEDANIGFSGNVNVEAWTGGSPTVMTTEELKYTIGKLIPGKYRFILNSYQFTDSFVFEVDENLEDNWEFYIPSPEDVSFTIKKEDDGKYYVVFAVDFPTEGKYRVEYGSELAVAAGVFPDGSNLISYKPVNNPKFFRYKGEAEATKTLYLKYPLAGPGRYTFELLGGSYSFTVN